MGDAHRLPYVLGVTSCNTGEGVSTLTAGLALTLARSMNGHVLLVDANMHRARKPKLYSEDKLSTSLVHLKGDGQGNTLILQPNLYMMQTTDVSGEMVTTKPAVRVDALVDSIRQNSSYACIILDMPPVMESALTARAASRCDSVVMVVEAERTHREVAIKAKKLLSQSGARLLGVVLNKHRHYVPKWLYTAC
jgi:Mrp family chromosome partitioning ATPase